MVQLFDKDCEGDGDAAEIFVDVIFSTERVGEYPPLLAQSALITVS
jgi:hypothetical protein